MPFWYQSEAKMKTQALFPLFISVLVLILPVSAYAAKGPVGNVVAVRGEAFAIGDDGLERGLGIKSAVYLHDTLKTGARGRLQVLFNDATIISVGPDSQMTVADYAWDGNDGRMENQVTEGFFHIMGGNIAKKSPKKFNTQTPIATIGIRGSTYAIHLDDNSLSVVFIGGTGIDVFNDSGRVEIDRPGFGTQLTQKMKKPQPPRKFSAAELGGILKHVQPEKKKHGGESKEGAPLRPYSPPIDRPEYVDAVDKEIDTNQQITQAHTTVPDFSGAYLNMLIDPDEIWLSLNRFSTGTLSGISREGHVAAQGESEDGRTFLFEFDMSTANPTGTYFGPTVNHSTLASFPLPDFGTDTTFSADRYESALGEFAILSIPQAPIDFHQETLAYAMVGYLGIPALQGLRPENVIFDYAGPAAGFSGRFDEDFMEGGTGWMKMRVNWHNNRFIGFIGEDSAGDIGNKLTPFFGVIKENEPVVAEAVFFGNFEAPDMDDGSMPDPGDEPRGPESFEPITWLTGSDTGFGRFYGSHYQGFGGLAQGSIVEVASDQRALSGEWYLAGAGFRSTHTETPGHGMVSLEGFVCGIAENMDAPHLSPRLFLNQVSSDFSMQIDRDAGVLTGNISATDFATRANSLAGVEIGGAWGSAYVDDDLYVALLGGDNTVLTSGFSGGLKPYGNHLEPTDPDLDLSAHTTWGYWEIAYDDPATSEPYHVHVPSSLWVAGQVTSEDTVRGLIQTGHIGRYEGNAIGALASPMLPHLMMLEGSIEMAINFSPSAQAPVTGSLIFSDPGIDLAIENGLVRPSGFSGSFQNTLQSEINGAFFGPGADAVAGNFTAILEQEGVVTGIFGADAIIE